MRSPIFVWATCFMTLFLTALLVCYTTTQSFNIKFQLLFNKPVRNTYQSAMKEAEHIEEEKFMTYIPHSGLHNQRIELINALVTAKALNRTLIAPVINIGEPIGWKPSPFGEERLGRCPSNYKKLKYCRDFEKYVPVSAEFIFDLNPAYASGIKVVQRKDMTLDYFQNTWGATEDDIYRINDNVRYSYRIYDSNEDKQNIRTFRYRINMEDLKERNERFIVFGSVFSTHRLALSNSHLQSLREYLRKELAISHAIVTRQALNIISLLGGPDSFYGVHLRQGDGLFAHSTDKTIQRLKSTLSLPSLKDYRFDDADNDAALTLAKNEISLISDTVEQHINTLNTIDMSSTNKMELLITCATFQSENVHPRLRLIYMATDTHQPRSTLKSLYDEFPCIFTLSDFPEIVEKTLMMQPMLSGNAEIDKELSELGTSISALLLPMIDAEVATHSIRFIGTRKSTFSKYINYRFTRFRQLFEKEF